MNFRRLIVHSILGMILGFLAGLYLFAQSSISQLFIGNTFYSVWYKIIPFFTLVGLLVGVLPSIFESRNLNEKGTGK